MRLFATQNVSGTLEAEPDFRVPPTTFAAETEVRRSNLETFVADFFKAAGITLTAGGGGLSITQDAQAAQTVYQSPGYAKPLTEQPLFWAIVGAGAVYLLTK